MHIFLDLVLLFFASFLAATIFPAQSEAVLAGVYASGDYNTTALLLVATLGNVLGSCINWLLGRYLTHFQHRKWFPVKAAALHKAEATYKKYGVWTLLFAWVPIIGDPLTLAAGLLRTPLLLFILLVTIGKATRYITIVIAI